MLQLQAIEERSRRLPPQFVEAYLVTRELTEGATVESSEFISLHSKEVKTLCFIGSYQLFCSDQCFPDFGEDFQEYSISLVSKQFCL